jgi:hypothetical protein
MSRTVREWISMFAGAAGAGFWSLHAENRGALSFVFALAAGACFSHFLIELTRLAREAGRRDAGGK